MSRDEFLISCYFAIVYGIVCGIVTSLILR
jgi:hypothetical protein